MDKKTPNSNKPKKVVEIKAVIKPQDILTPQTDPAKLEKLGKIVSSHVLLIINFTPDTLIAMKGTTRKVQKYNPHAVTGPKEPIVEMQVPCVYAINYVVEPFYIKEPKARARWTEELLKNKTYQQNRKFWENLGVHYIIDFDLNSINKSLQEDK